MNVLTVLWRRSRPIVAGVLIPETCGETVDVLYLFVVRGVGRAGMVVQFVAGDVDLC